MTKEELKKEAEEKAGIYFDSLDYDHGNVSDTPFSSYDVYTAYKKGALDFTEPREKRIAELEAQIEELKKKLKEKLKTIADKDLSFVAKFDALEKENAELKHTIAELRRDKDNLNMHTKAQEKLSEYRSDQLTKAKEHIRTLISCLIDWVQEGDKDYCHIAEAEQFLNSEVEK